jgi:hypothetical protein
LKPIAWTDDLWNIFLNDEYCMLDDDMKKDMIPLYTAPRELSDEEILALWAQKNNLNGAKDIIDFARAILEKASEE